MESDPAAGNAPGRPPGPREPELTLEPLEVHIAQLRAELQRTQLVLGLAGAAAVLAALACLYAARAGASSLPVPVVSS